MAAPMVRAARGGATSPPKARIPGWLPGVTSGAGPPGSRPAPAPRARENAALGAAALRPPRLRLQQEQQEAALCAAGAAAGPPQPQPRRGGHGPAQQDQPLHPGAAPRHHGPGPRQALPALREDRLHQSHPGQDDQQVQRLRLRRLRQPHGGPEGCDGAQGQRGAGADGQATGAGPHQPLHLEPAAGGGRAGAGGAAEALRAGGLDPHPAGPPWGQPRRGLRTDGIHGEVRGRHHPLQREVHQDAPGGASPPGPAALQVRGRGAEEAAEPGEVRAQRESLGPGRRRGHRDLGLRPCGGVAERVLPGALRPGPQPDDRPHGPGPLPALPRLLLPGPWTRLDAPVLPRAAHGRGAGPRCGPRCPPPALRGGPPGPAARPPFAGQRRHVRARCRRRPWGLHPAVPAGAARPPAGGRQRRPEPRPHRVTVRARRLPLPLPQVAVGGGRPEGPRTRRLLGGAVPGPLPGTTPPAPATAAASGRTRAPAGVPEPGEVPVPGVPLLPRRLAAPRLGSPPPRRAFSPPAFSKKLTGKKKKKKKKMTNAAPGGWGSPATPLVLPGPAAPPAPRAAVPPVPSAARSGWCPRLGDRGRGAIADTPPWGAVSGHQPPAGPGVLPPPPPQPFLPPWARAGALHAAPRPGPGGQDECNNPPCFHGRPEGQPGTLESPRPGRRSPGPRCPPAQRQSGGPAGAALATKD